MRAFCGFGTVLTIAIFGFAQMASAQSLRDFGSPAERPPAAYPGSQYVDSRGCLFIRSRGGANEWVPRVRRDRTVICGQLPSLAGGATQAAAATATASQPAPSQPPRASAARVATATATATAPMPLTLTMRRVEPISAPAAVAPGQAAQTQTARSASKQMLAPCVVLPATGVCVPAAWAPRVDLAHKGPVVANPQSAQARPQSQRQPAVGVAPAAQAVIAAAPRRLASAPRSLTHGESDAQSYRQSWGDGRLNPLRGLRQGGTVATTQTISPQTAASVSQQPARGGRHVQAGSFVRPSDAQTAGHQLQRLGLPVRIFATRRYHVVMVGPLPDARSQSAALQATRSAGFRDAFVRR